MKSALRFAIKFIEELIAAGRVRLLVTVIAMSGLAGAAYFDRERLIGYATLMTIIAAVYLVVITIRTTKATSHQVDLDDPEEN